MLYELVIIAAASGALTPFATYPSQAECKAAQADISTTTACRPVKSPAEAQAEMAQFIPVFFGMVNTLKSHIDAQ